MANARSDERHPKCVNLHFMIFSATPPLLFLSLELGSFSGLLFMSFYRLVTPFLLPPFLDIS